MMSTGKSFSSPENMSASESESDYESYEEQGEEMEENSEFDESGYSTPPSKERSKNRDPEVHDTRI